jgi:hypothetical protein
MRSVTVEGLASGLREDRFIPSSVNGRDDIATYTERSYGDRQTACALRCRPTSIAPPAKLASTSRVPYVAGGKP